MDAGLSHRLSTIWKSPDFTSLFTRYSKRSPYAIKKGIILFNEGDQTNKLYFIKDGFIKLYRLSEDGKEPITYLYGPGNILGLRALTCEDMAAKHNAETITNATIMTLSRQEYLDAIAKEPSLLVDLLHAFIDRLNYTERKLEGFITTDSTARTATFLYNCAIRFCLKSNEPITLPLSLTHQQIAEFVGSIRETVSVAMKKLEKEGIISDKRGIIIIRNTEKLKHITQNGKKMVSSSLEHQKL